MENLTKWLPYTLAIGFGATAAMDLWRLGMQRVFGVSSLDLGLLGRWVGHSMRGRIVHHPIGQSPRITGELAIGWVSHYAIGMGFAVLLPVFWGVNWLASPSVLPALVIGLGTIFAPWLIMQPAMGLGLAARFAKKPNAVRLRNLAIHTVYGFGLYFSALGMRFLSNKAGAI